MNKVDMRALSNKIKLENGCEMCGYNKNAAALSFDHLDPSIKYRTRSGNLVHIADMTKGARYGLDTVLAEISKCRIVCMNCHMEHTYPQSANPAHIENQQLELNLNA